MWKHMSDAAKKEAKQNGLSRNQDRQCQTIERKILHWATRWRIQAHKDVFAQVSCACFCCDRWSTTLTGDTMSGVARDVVVGAAKRRRERRYRSFWWDEVMAVRMATLTACHHSAQKKLAATHAATQTTVTYGEQAPVFEYVTPALVLADFLEPLVPVEYMARAPDVTCPARNIGKRKTKYACVVDADESTRPRQERAGQKGRILRLITVFFTNSLRRFKHWNFQMQRHQWKNNGKNSRKFRHGSWKSQIQERCDQWSKE